MNYYDILNIQTDATSDEIKVALENYENQLYEDRINDKISAQEFNDLIDEFEEIKKVLLNDDLRQEYDKKFAKRKRQNTGKGKKKTGAVVAGAVAASLIVAALIGTNADKISTLFRSTGGDVTVSQDVNQENNDYTSGNTSTGETAEAEDNIEVLEETPEPINYGDINDDALVTERATTLVNQLNDMGIINPSTGTAYTVEEIKTLILYINGVYTPTTLEEIDVLHLNLLNLLISPLNVDPYLYHVVYASGNDDFKDMVNPEAIKPIDFGSALAEYGTNGVYPLTEWIQQKREDIFKATDRETINSIYVEVGQVMADIMKGNGCTIKVDDVEYTYTSEQILANHASVMLLTTEAQLIFANHYEVRDINDNVIDSVQTTWEVYNKFNGDEPDHVTLDEIQAWINNGCDYEWGIDDVLINGQTFGQRIQGDLEGMAQNNYAMSAGKTLSK